MRSTGLRMSLFVLHPYAGPASGPYRGRGVLHLRAVVRLEGGFINAVLNAPKDFRRISPSSDL